MRVINRWIASGDYKLEAAIIREMATLAFTEVIRPTLPSLELLSLLRFPGLSWRACCC
jgi:hypothetical protein